MIGDCDEGGRRKDAFDVPFVFVFVCLCGPNLLDLTVKFLGARIVDALQNSILLHGSGSIAHCYVRHAEVVMR